MKSFIWSAWLSVAILLNWFGEFVSAVTGQIDWTLIGWSFGSSTAFVVYEATKKIKRPGWHRVGMVGIGMLVSLGLGPWLSEYLKIPPVPMTILLGTGGYKILDNYITKKLKDPEKTAKDLTGLND